MKRELSLHGFRKSAYIKAHIVQLLCMLPFSFLSLSLFSQEKVEFSFPHDYKPVTWVDNMGYWQQLAKDGKITVQPHSKAPHVIWKGSLILAPGIATYDSPDVPVSETSSLQSENSIFADPDNGLRILNSNNSYQAPYSGVFYGADALSSEDGGVEWEGTIQGAGGQNFGDPATVINRNGRMFVGSIFSGGGQGIAFSDNGGSTWTKKGVASAPTGLGNLLDKNHLWVDNSLTSPYNGYLYDGWTVLGGNYTGEIQISRSMDNGMAWQFPVVISEQVMAGGHNQGINISTGPNGEVYAAWSIYDAWPGNEAAIGFAVSLNGGQTWLPSHRIIDNISGIRTLGVNKRMRVNSFPSMAVDNSNGPNRGSIYIVWANYGVPGTNNGPDISIYMIKSADQGDTWSTPVKVNQDPAGTNKQHYFPWMSCDPATGFLSVVFYDDRNVDYNMAEAWMAVSRNGGISWQDFRVSDVAFTPEPIAGSASDYFGDYLGMASQNGTAYPCWTDNRTGEAMAYVSPVRISPPPGQAYMDYYSHQIRDSINGNNNGVAEYGESFALQLALRNIGDVADSAVNVSLSSSSPYVSITNNTCFFGNFSPGEIKTLDHVFQLQLADSVPNHYEVQITVTAHDANDSVFLSSFSIPVLAPEVSVGEMHLLDDEGNNNRHLDPGEKVTAKILLSNTGNYAVQTIEARLSSSQLSCSITNPLWQRGELLPGQTDTAVWQIQVDTSAVAGTSVALNCKLNFAGQEHDKLFPQKIGIITEDWESGDLSQMAWQTNGKRPWFVTQFKAFEGLYSLRSGYISSLDTSRVEILVDLFAFDSISFYRKVSSELGYDFLSFYIDKDKVGLWSGNRNWERVSYPLMPGRHVLKWEYTKDEGLSAGNDAAWIDMIQFPVLQRTTVYAGDDKVICQGEVYQANGLATNFISAQWLSSGTGLFNNPEGLVTSYIPSSADIAAGSVQLILQITGFSFGEIVQDTLVLAFSDPVVVNAGPDGMICTGQAYSTRGSVLNYDKIKWSTHGDGTFDDPDTLFTNYIPGPLEIKAGKTILYLKAFSGNTCPAVIDTVMLNIYPGFEMTFTGDTTICEGDTAMLRIHFSGTGPWRVFRSDGSKISVSKDSLIIAVSPHNTTIYAIDSVVSVTGCVLYTIPPVIIHVNHAPDVKIVGTEQVCASYPVILQAEADSVLNYTWWPGGSDRSFAQFEATGTIGSKMLYTLTLKGINTCSRTDSLYLLVSDKCLEKYAGNVSVRLYPNPFKGQFFIELASLEASDVDIEIFSGNNKPVKKLPDQHVTGVISVPVDMSDMASGVYTLQIKSSTGEWVEQIINIK